MKKPWGFRQKKYVICGTAAVILIGYAFYVRADYGQFSGSIIFLTITCLASNTVDKKLPDRGNPLQAVQGEAVDALKNIK